MRVFCLLVLGALPWIGGCHSAIVDATLTNASSETIQLIEVDYPSASFGTQALGAGQTFHYRFKVLGNGPLKLSWTDAARKDHAATGPTVTEGTEGTIAIAVSGGAATWQTHFKAGH